MTDTIVITRSTRILNIRLNRPERKNAITQSMYGRMADALVESAKGVDIRAVVITGTGDSFTSGNDLGDFANRSTTTKAPVVRFLEAIRDIDIPIVVAVNGVAIGIGLTMLLHADLIFAAESATFSAPFVQLGLVPEAGSSLLLPLAVGNAWTNDILLAGRKLNAQEALQCGLVSRVVADDALAALAESTAQKLASMAPGAMRHTKRLVRANRASIAHAMERESELFATQLASTEFAECVAAFQQKRTPDFQSS